MALTFNNPSYLWLFLSLPLLTITHFILLRHIKRKAMKFVNFEAMKRVSGITLLTKNIPILVLRLSILLFLILAVSGTTYWYYGETNENDFVLAIDTSASMTTKDFEPSRLEAAKDAAKDFTNSLTTKTEIGVVSFAGIASIEQLPTADLLKVKQKINEIDIMVTGGTDLSAAIITSTNMLLNSRKGKTIILITDGSNTAGPFVDDIVQRGIEYARKHHVVVHTIGIGTNESLVGFLPEELGVTSVFDTSTLERIASETNGEFYKAENKEEIASAYKSISEMSEEGFIAVDLKFTFLLIALTLVFVEWGLINTRFRALP
jgi:Ca-activated chloride channel family protein